MRVNILFFGKLAEIAGTSLSIEHVRTTDELTEKLCQQYPSLANEKYVMAVEKKMINADTVLPDNCTVALLPPFSGG